MVPKPLYLIDLDEYLWVLRLSGKEQKRAYAIWKKRYDRLFELICGMEYIDSIFYFASRLESEMYQRLCAIKYPETLSSLHVYDNPNVPVGSLGMIRHEKKVTI